MPNKPRFDWDSVDWTQQDVVISERLGCTRERVRQKRRTLDKPQSPWKRENRLTRRLRELVSTNPDLFVKLSISQIEQAIGYNPNRTLQKILGEAGIEKRTVAVHTVLPAALVNWDLPSCDLERIWNTSFNRAGSTRYLLGKPKPKWNYGKGNHLGLGNPPNDLEYYRAIQTEIIKAADWHRERKRLVEELKAAVNGVGK